MILAAVLLAAKPVLSGAVAGRAPAESVVFLVVPVSEVSPSASGAALKLAIQNGLVVPRVTAAPLGSALQITQLDSVFSDLSVYFGLSELAFRRKFVLPGDVSHSKLTRPGLMTIENENDPTHRAYIYVTPTGHFAVTGANGRYRLENVPAGKRRFTAWDEKNGTLDREVVVKAGETGQLDFEAKK